MMKLSICLISLFTLSCFSLMFFFSGLLFLYLDLIYFIEWEVLSLNSSSIVMTFLFDWMSFLFMSFVLLISSLVIFYSKEYMSSDFNINHGPALAQGPWRESHHKTKKKKFFLVKTQGTMYTGSFSLFPLSCCGHEMFFFRFYMSVQIERFKFHQNRTSGSREKGFQRLPFSMHFGNFYCFKDIEIYSRFQYVRTYVSTYVRIQYLETYKFKWLEILYMPKDRHSKTFEHKKKYPHRARFGDMSVLSY